MRAQALLPTLLLCVLLLQAQGGHRNLNRSHRVQVSSEINECKKRTKIEMCKRPCTHHQECQANNVCCTTFCGNVCMNIL